MGYLMLKTSLLKNSKWYYLTHCWGNKGVYTIPKGINPKMNVIAWLEFELAYFKASIQHFSHYTMGTSPHIYCLVSLFKGISTFMGYLMPKQLLLKNSSDTI